MGKGCLVVAVVVLLLVVIAGGVFISNYNKVARLDEAVKASWRQIDTVLQRRNDLIPNLVRTVKGYAAHEKEIFTEITKLRSQWSSAKTNQEKMKAARGMDGAISRLLLVAENYPNLKANETFLKLQDQLEGTENRIAVQRMRYNNSVRTFNTYIRSFVGEFFARKRGLTEPAPYFEAEEKAREVPKVEF